MKNIVLFNDAGKRNGATDNLIKSFIEGAKNNNYIKNFTYRT